MPTIVETYAFLLAAFKYRQPKFGRALGRVLEFCPTRRSRIKAEIVIYATGGPALHDDKYLDKVIAGEVMPHHNTLGSIIRALPPTFAIPDGTLPPKSTEPSDRTLWVRGHLMASRKRGRSAFARAFREVLDLTGDNEFSLAERLREVYPATSHITQPWYLRMVMEGKTLPHLQTVDEFAAALPGLLTLDN